MKEILDKLLAREPLTRDEARFALSDIAAMRSNPAQTAALLTLYRLRGPNVNELLGFRDAMLELAKPLNLSGYHLIDLCGTGGDGKNTFNISTIASFVVAAAGIAVAKHGNYGASSACGSSNLIEALGLPFALDEASARQCLDKAGIVILHAPLWHPAMKKVAPLRKELGFSTIFNLLGPICNPARPQAQFTGVYSKEIQNLYAGLLGQTLEAYSVVHTLDGYDEVSLTAKSRIITHAGEEILSPQQLGFAPLHPGDLLGADTPIAGADIALQILSNKAPRAKIDAVVVNAGLAIRTVFSSKPLEECMHSAKEAIASGQALKVVQTLRNIKSK